MIISSKLLPRERPGEHGQQGGLCVRMDKTAQGSHTPNSSGPRDADRLRDPEDEGAHRGLRRGAGQDIGGSVLLLLYTYRTQSGEHPELPRLLPTARKKNDT